MQGQTGIAKKVYECVPISEPWRSFQVLSARSCRFRTDPPHWY